MKPQFLIAAPSSNSGKTTVTLALLKLLSNKGYKVQAFKCGPDYIDPKHHATASGSPSINLDTFMMSDEHVKDLYFQYSRSADISILEGVMGLFDGAEKMKGSSAEIAILLNLPVILVVNAKATAYSVAPLIYGFKNFNPKLNLVGVIFNQVNTESHYSFLKDACEDVGVESLGYIPVNDEIHIPSRHLGLAITSENDYKTIIEKAAEHISKSIVVEKILDICNIEEAPLSERSSIYKSSSQLTIAIARDEAFNFTYYQNIETLKQLGKVEFFSPLNDHQLPKADIIYLSGGYPELFLEKLSSNISMQKSILEYCKNGGKLLAECGGLMYLGKQIINKEGQSFPMVGFFDIETSMEKAKLSLGYRKMIFEEKVFKGHEFHYSIPKELSETNVIGDVVNAKDKSVDCKIYRKNKVIASYMHFYWGESLKKFPLEDLIN